MKVQTTLRVDKLLLARFKVLCQGKRLRVGEAVQRRAEELRLRSALAELRGFIKAVDGSDEWFVSDKDGEVRIDRAIHWLACDMAVARLLGCVYSIHQADV